MTKQSSTCRRKAASSKTRKSTFHKPLTYDDLPSPDTKRWVMRRKAVVVAGVRSGLISLNEACQRYTLSVDEFLSWQQLFDSYGLPGLRSTRTKEYRSV